MLVLLMLVACVAATQWSLINRMVSQVHSPNVPTQTTINDLNIALHQTSQVSLVQSIVGIEDYHSQSPTRGLTQLPPSSQQNSTSNEVIGIEELCSIDFTQQYINPVIVYRNIRAKCSGFNIQAASTPPKPKQFKCLVCPISDTCQACTYYNMLLQYSKKYSVLLSCIGGKNLTTRYSNQLVRDMGNVELAIQKLDDEVEYVYRIKNRRISKLFFLRDCEGLFNEYEGCKITADENLICGAVAKLKCCGCYCSLGLCRRRGCINICDKAICCQKKPFPWRKQRKYRSNTKFCKKQLGVGKKK